MANVYLKTALGNRIVSSPGNPIVVFALLDGGYIALAQPLRFIVRVPRYTALTTPIRAHARAGYTLSAYNFASGVETALGFVPAGQTLSLSGIALADGHYEIRARLSGYYWRDELQLTRFPLRIVDGAPVVPLPAIRNLQYSYTTTQTLLSWSFELLAGEVQPQDFAIWTSAVAPVDTSGAPTAVVTAGGPGSYSRAVIQGAAVLYAAICARKDGSRGAIAEITIPAPPPLLASPANQRSDWSL